MSIKNSELPLKLAGRVDVSFNGETKSINANRLLEGYRKVLDSLTSDTKLSDVLSQIASIVEQLLEPSYCSILLFDQDSNQFQLGASPSLSAAFTSEIGKLASNPETPFYVAVRRKEFMMVHHNSGGCIGLSTTLLNYGLQTCWIQPIISRGGEGMGIISFFHKELSRPTYADLQLLEEVSKGATLAIDRHKKYKELERLAYYDSLTGLPNRELLITELGKTIGKSRKENSRFALAIIDCDRFKVLNNTYGHHIGDQILKSLSQKLKNSVHKNDFVSRLYGDEFMILLREVRTRDDLLNRIKNITNIFKDTWNIGEEEFYITASLGVVEYPFDASNPEELLNKANTAIQHAKREGRNLVRFFRREMCTTSSNRLSLEKDLHYALERGELTLYYQPQVNITEGKVVGAEGLLRWNHPKYGLISPADFVPILEDTGLILSIGEWLVREACSQHVKWMEEGLPALNVSVNISPTQFRSNIIVRAVNAALDSVKMSPSFLKLEITESMLIDQSEDTIKILRGLNHIGIGVSIDDFGTGYSSLSYLKKFPLQTIKIDRTFIKEIENDIQDQAIVKAIIEMAKSLNLDLIAEGTENDKQIRFLKNAGCENVQGYYFSRPVPPELFAQHYSDWVRNVKTLQEQLI